MEPILTIDNLNSFGGNMLRQGDKSQLKYRLRDVGNKNLGISSKSCDIKMYGRNYTTVVYETTTTVSSDNTVSFTINKVLPKGTFYLEFTVGDYIFPTDHREYFEITPSGKGMEANIIEIVGKDVLIQEVKRQVDTELQPLVTSLESAQQAETQRASNETVRVSAEAQRVTDHANRSAELDSKADKVVIENLNKNGDFSDGLTNWSGNSGAVLEQTPEGLSFNTDSVTSLYYSADNIVDVQEIKSGDIIYSSISGIIEGNVPVNITIELVGYPGVKILEFDPTNLGTDFTPSGIYKFDDGFSFSKIRYVYRYSSGDVSGTNIIRNVITVNLTQAFGAGNEPTKEQMDELIKVTGYIDGEYALNNKEMLRYLIQDIQDIRENTVLEDGSVTRIKLDSTLQSLLNDWEAVLTNENESWVV